MIGFLSDCFHGAAPVQAGGFPCARSSGGRSDAHGLAHSIGSTEYQTGIRRFAGCPFQTVERAPEVSEGRSPPIANPKPAACIAAQIQPSADFGLRCCGSPSGCPHTSVRFAHPSGGFGTLA